MTKTEHYELNQWDASDRVLMEDFNEDNAKLDAALAQKAGTAELSALTQQVASKAEQSALAAVQAELATKAGQDALEAVQAQLPRKAEIIFGTYTGNGEASQFISLGRTPQAVFVLPADGAICDLYGTDSLWGGLALTDTPAVRNSQNIVSIESGGFRVYYSTASSKEYIFSNQSDKAFHYIAFCFES